MQEQRDYQRPRGYRIQQNAALYHVIKVGKNFLMKIDLEQFNRTDLFFNACSYFEVARTQKWKVQFLFKIRVNREVSLCTSWTWLLFVVNYFPLEKCADYWQTFLTQNVGCNFRFVSLFPHHRIYFTPNQRNQEYIQPEAAKVLLSLSLSQWGGVTLSHFPHPENTLSLINCESQPPVNVLWVFSLSEWPITGAGPQRQHFSMLKVLRGVACFSEVSLKLCNLFSVRFAQIFPGLNNALQSLGVIAFLVNKHRLAAPVMLSGDMKAALPKKSASVGRKGNNKNAGRLNSVWFLPCFPSIFKA